VVLGLTAVVFGGVIVGGVPRIDVWDILQDVANGLLHHQNPYDMRFPNVPAGETATCFNYLPSTFLITAPSAWLFGDVRWVEAGCLLGSAALSGWHVGRRRGLPLALLVAGLPGTLLVVQQAWTEPMLLVLLCVAAVAVDRGRWWLAVVAVGVALANKQHAVVLLPFLLLHKGFGSRRTLIAGAVGASVSLPWVLMDPARFKTCVADFYLDERAPTMSVSVWRWLPAGWGLPVLLLGTAAVTVLALRRCPRGGAGMLLGCGMVLLTFDLLNKQTFLNQWWLAASLLLAGMAMAARLGEPFGQEGALDVVVGERQRLLVGRGGLRPPVQPAQEVGTGRAEVAVGGQRRIVQQRSQHVEAGLRAVAQADGDSTVEPDHGRWPQP
jgi:hypothetical protein